MFANVRPIYKIPISVPIKNFCSSDDYCSNNNHSSKCDQNINLTVNSSKSGSGVAKSSVSKVSFTDKDVRGLSWSPSHICRGKLLAVACASSICIWEVPDFNGDRHSGGVIMEAGEDSVSARAKVSDLPKVPIICPLPARIAPLAPMLQYSLSLASSSLMSSSPSSTSAAAVNFSTSTHATNSAATATTKKTNYNLKRIEWHSSALPTLLTFSVGNNPIMIQLPRRSHGVKISNLFDFKTKSSIDSNVNKETSIIENIESAQIATDDVCVQHTVTDTLTSAGTGTDAAATTGVPTKSSTGTITKALICPNLEFSTDLIVEKTPKSVFAALPSKRVSNRILKKAIQPYGCVSLKGKSIYTADCTGSITVVLDPLNDATNTISLGALASESLNENLLNNTDNDLRLTLNDNFDDHSNRKELKAMCINSDDSIICLSYSLSSQSLLAPSSSTNSTLQILNPYSTKDSLFDNSSSRDRKSVV